MGVTRVTVRCKLEIAERARTVTPDAIVETGEDRTIARRRVVDQVADWLDAEAGAAQASGAWLCRGRIYRQLLEARWAGFFDALDLAYFYEVGGCGRGWTGG